MRYRADNPLVIGDVTESSPVRRVIATGVGIGHGFDLNERLYVQGVEAERLVLEGMLILDDLADDESPGTRAHVADRLSPRQVLERRRGRRPSNQRTKRQDGTVGMAAQVATLDGGGEQGGQRQAPSPPAGGMAPPPILGPPAKPAPSHRGRKNQRPSAGAI